MRELRAIRREGAQAWSDIATPDVDPVGQAQRAFGVAARRDVNVGDTADARKADRVRDGAAGAQGATYTAIPVDHRPLIAARRIAPALGNEDTIGRDAVDAITVAVFARTANRRIGQVYTALEFAEVLAAVAEDPTANIVVVFITGAIAGLWNSRESGVRCRRIVGVVAAGALEVRRFRTDVPAATAVQEVFVEADGALQRVAKPTVGPFLARRIDAAGVRQDGVAVGDRRERRGVPSTARLGEEQLHEVEGRKGAGDTRDRTAAGVRRVACDLAVGVRQVIASISGEPEPVSKVKKL